MLKKDIEKNELNFLIIIINKLIWKKYQKTQIKYLLQKFLMRNLEIIFEFLIKVFDVVVYDDVKNGK